MPENDSHDTEKPSFDVAGCLGRVGLGDQAAARELVDHLHPLVVKIVRANLPRRASDEEDIVQVILTRVFTKLDQYGGQVPLEHWVSRIAVNHCVNTWRAQRARPEWRHADLSQEQVNVIEDTAIEDRDPRPGEALAAREILGMIMEQLGAAERTVIQLLEIEDRTVREVSALTGWSGPVVRIRAFRARRKMNQLYRSLKAKESR